MNVLFLLNPGPLLLTNMEAKLLTITVYFPSLRLYFYLVYNYFFIPSIGRVSQSESPFSLSLALIVKFKAKELFANGP